MATIKSYTDLSQSKKLAEILYIETADMYYSYGMDINTKEWSLDETPTIIDANNQIDINDIPCWSLSALLNVLGEGYSLGNRNRKYYVCMSHIHHEMSLFDNPVDACVDMIIKLKEADLL